MQSSVTITEEEELTSLLTVPVMSGSSSVWHATVCGFNSGVVRVFSESGALLLQKCFLQGPVRAIKVQSMPEGKHYTNILHQQTVLELLLIYSSTVVAVTGTDLYNILRENLSGLAVATAHGLAIVPLSTSRPLSKGSPCPRLALKLPPLATRVHN